MDTNYVRDQYLEDSILTATPEQLTLMLFNGCIKNVRLGTKGIEEKGIENAHNHIIKAQNIIYELKGTLDPRYEISGQLSRIYDFILEQMVRANMKKDNEYLEVALDLVTKLRDTWFEAMKLKDKENGTVVAI